MLRIKVNIKVKHVVTKDKIIQYFAILSYNDFFLEDSFSFYRKLKSFLEKFYLSNEAIYVSPGINQYQIHYKKLEDSRTFQDIDEYFDFAIPEKTERICNSCEFYKDKYCNFYEKKIEDIPDYCFYWSEKD